MSRGDGPAAPDATPRDAKSGPQGEQAAPARLTHRQIVTVLSGLMLGMFLAALDQMVVSSALRTIADDLHGLTAQAWVTTAYLVAGTIATPLYGKLSDIHGRMARLSVGDRPVRRRVAAVRIRHVHPPARGLPGGAGNRRRRTDVARDDDHRRHHLAA